MSYRVERTNMARESFDNYEYEIFKDDCLIATYWVDFRGDDNAIDFVGGPGLMWPVGGVGDFFSHGGSEAPVLSAKAIDFLDSYTNQTRRAEAVDAGGQPTR